MEQYLNLINSNYRGTVERFLRIHTALTRRQISYAKFQENGICRNGIRCRISESVFPGDTISILLENEEMSSHLLPPSENMPPLEILYEDSALIAANKPAGIPTHPCGCHENDTLSNQVLFFCRGKEEDVCCRPVGRLDLETSGIVIFAKNRPAAAILQKQRKAGIFRKQYLAVASGLFPPEREREEQVISLPLMRDPGNPLRMRAVKDADEFYEEKQAETAVTHYRILGNASQWALVLLRLETGRTHQIRVHMAASGHALLGDTLYGNPGFMPDPFHFQRAALHAWKCRLRHPFTEEIIDLEAPFPEDFSAAASFLQQTAHT